MRVEKISRSKIKQNEITRFIKLDKGETKQKQDEIFKFIELSWNEKRRRRDKISRFNKLGKRKKENLCYLSKIWTRLSEIRLIEPRLGAFELTRHYWDKIERSLLSRQDLSKT